MGMPLTKQAEGTDALGGNKGTLLLPFFSSPLKPWHS